MWNTLYIHVVSQSVVASLTRVFITRYKVNEVILIRFRFGFLAPQRFADKKDRDASLRIAKRDKSRTYSYIILVREIEISWRKSVPGA